MQCGGGGGAAPPTLRWWAMGAPWFERVNSWPSRVCLAGPFRSGSIRDAAECRWLPRRCRRRFGEALPADARCLNERLMRLAPSQRCAGCCQSDNDLLRITRQMSA